MSVRKRKEDGTLAGYASAKSHLHPFQSKGHGKSVCTRFERVVNPKLSSGTPTTRTTPFSPHRGVCTRSNMPWKP